MTYYTVWKGRRPGVYDSWEGCKQQTEGFSGPSFKKFPTYEEAKREFRQGDPKSRKQHKPMALTPPRKVLTSPKRTAAPPKQTRSTKSSPRQRSPPPGETATTPKKIYKSESLDMKPTPSPRRIKRERSATPKNSGRGSQNGRSATPQVKMDIELEGENVLFTTIVPAKLFGKK